MSVFIIGSPMIIFLQCEGSQCIIRFHIQCISYTIFTVFVDTDKQMVVVDIVSIFYLQHINRFVKLSCTSSFACITIRQTFRRTNDIRILSLLVTTNFERNQFKVRTFSLSSQQRIFTLLNSVQIIRICSIIEELFQFECIFDYFITRIQITQCIDRINFRELQCIRASELSVVVS